MEPGNAQYHSSKSSNPIKNIMVFCDGSGKNMSENGESTNIWKLYNLMTEINPVSAGTPTVESEGHEIIYIPGVGINAVVGAGIVVEVMLEAYLHVARHYRKGDQI
ncbi:hypothetical protein BDV93DRAFT_529584 [Ceratobasidium sp. AG-I]|nr:hypothetical protein BDV93DRAFT_529584 [Ceratobasidium sp. AG-I]